MCVVVRIQTIKETQTNKQQTQTREIRPPGPDKRGDKYYGEADRQGVPNNCQQLPFLPRMLLLKLSLQKQKLLEAEQTYKEALCRLAGRNGQLEGAGGSEKGAGRGSLLRKSNNSAHITLSYNP